MDRKPQTITLGNYPCINLAEARDTALSYRNLINKKIDSSEKNTEAEQINIIFGVVADQWFQKTKVHGKILHVIAIQKAFPETSYPSWVKPINEITKADLLSNFNPHENLGSPL